MNHFTREHGHTVLELIVVVSLLAGALAVSFQLFTHASRTNRLVAGYAGDVDRVRRAARAMERDIRAARSLEVGEDGDTLTVGRVLPGGGDGEGGSSPTEVTYRLRRGRLERLVDGEARTGISRVAGLEVRREGALVRVRIELEPRAEDPRRRPVVVTRVLVRGEVER